MWKTLNLILYNFVIRKQLFANVMYITGTNGKVNAERRYYVFLRYLLLKQHQTKQKVTNGRYKETKKLHIL